MYNEYKFRIMRASFSHFSPFCVCYWRIFRNYKFVVSVTRPEASHETGKNGKKEMKVKKKKKRRQGWLWWQGKEREVHVARKHFCLQVLSLNSCSFLLQFFGEVGSHTSDRNLVTRSIEKCPETDRNVIIQLQITIGSEKLLPKLD